MKNKSLKFFDKIIMALMGLFPFFSGCDEPREMYGTPTADYLIKGTVTDERTNTPIKDVRVILTDNRDEVFLVSDTIYSDINGKYAFEFSRFPKTTITFGLIAEDIDETANGGLYETSVNAANVNVFSWDKSDADGWYSGKATVVKDIKLKK